jgi:hypothetical protein
MSRSRVAWCLTVGACLLLAGCPDSQQAGSGGRQAAGATGRQKGLQDAERDVKDGVLKLKEYPPLPYSLQEMRYIRLLKDRYGVGHEVLSGPGNDPALREEVQAYNGVVNAEIRKKFGDDILTKLREEAARR